MLFKRVVTAVIGAALVLSMTWLGGIWLASLFAAIAAISTLEIGAMMRVRLNSMESIVAVTFTVLMVLIPKFVEFWYVLFYLLLFLTIFRRKQFSFPAAGVLFAGALYSSYAFRTMLDIRSLTNGLAFVLLVFIAIWSTDTGAFFIGRALGGRKLLPDVSPKKTISGALGGLIAAMGFTLLGGALLIDHGANHWLAFVFLGVVISVAGQAGDLIESALKRHYEVKDSGWILPGHGGLLDRFDSLLLAAPIAYHVIVWLFPHV